MVSEETLVLAFHTKTELLLLQSSCVGIILFYGHR